jgi:MFS family permease
VTVLVTLPGLVVPFIGGVLIDRLDRRYLAITLDVSRGAVVLGTAAIAWWGKLHVWQVDVMVFLLGVGFAIYWSTTHALLQEVVPRAGLVSGNAAVLVAVQGGMMTAGALVGFVYDHWGIGAILGVDGATYVVSALCLWRLRRGYHAPHAHAEEPATEEPAMEDEVEAPVPPVLLDTAEAQAPAGMLADIREGLRYLRSQPEVLSLGLTYSCMMAGVLSGNVLLVALAQNVLDAGAQGFGFLESGWALGAIAGGLATAWLTHRRPFLVLVAALGTLAIGHATFPYARWLALAVGMNAVFGACRALGGVLTQSTIMATVPRRLMGRTQSAFSVISTLMQVAMSFTLGWLAQHIGLALAFGVLGVLYGGAAAAALRARALSHAARAGD